MLKEISIKNFRCFNDSTLKGFNRINLIGGKNNAGKTALLEALYLNFSPKNSTVKNLQMFRQEDDRISRQFPELTWENYFYNQQEDSKISIVSLSDDQSKIEVEICCDEDIADYINNTEEENDDNTEFAQLKKNLVNAVKSALHINSKKDGNVYSSSILIASSTRPLVDKETVLPETNLIEFVHSKFGFTQQSLARDFDLAFDKGYYEYIIKALKLIDDSIVEARTSSISTPVIKIRREGQNAMSLPYYGDAMNKIMSIVLKLLKGKGNGILLIDEIENGIHYTSHKEFWKMLFELANEFNIQIFATSHSLEMIKAFNEVASENEFGNMATYFEMTRHAKTNNIIVNPMDMDMLNYEIKSHSSFRGE